MPTTSQLTVRPDGGADQAFDGSRDVLIGRAQDADIRIDASFIAERQAVLRPVEGRWTFVADGGASYHGGTLVRQLELTERTTVMLGKMRERRLRRVP